MGSRPTVPEGGRVPEFHPGRSRVGLPRGAMQHPQDTGPVFARSRSGANPPRRRERSSGPVGTSALLKVARVGPRPGGGRGLRPRGRPSGPASPGFPAGRRMAFDRSGGSLGPRDGPGAIGPEIERSIPGGAMVDPAREPGHAPGRGPFEDWGGWNLVRETPVRRPPDRGLADETPATRRGSRDPCASGTRARCGRSRASRSCGFISPKCRGRRRLARGDPAGRPTATPPIPRGIGPVARAVRWASQEAWSGPRTLRVERIPLVSGREVRSGRGRRNRRFGRPDPIRGRPGGSWPRASRSRSAWSCGR